MFLRKGTFIITSLALAASAAIGRVSAVKVAPTSTEDHLLSTYDPYDNGDITTLLVSYRDDAGHENVVNHTIKMKGQGKSVNEKKNFKLKAKHKVEKKKKGKSSGSKDKKGKSEKDRRLNLFEVEEDDNAFISGFSIIEVKSDDIDAEIAALSALPGVTYVEEDSMMHILSTEYQQNLRGEGGVAEHVREIQDSIKATADEIIGDGDSNHGRRLAEETPYGIEMVNAEYVWNKGPPPTSSPKMKICVVDTGYDLGHKDLPKTSHGVAGWNDDSGQFGRWENDGHGHGTHCAGTIGAIGNNNKGVTSVNPDPDKFDFFIGKGLSDGGSGTNANVLNAVKECVDNGAKVISMSLGGSLNSATANTVYEDAYDSGVLIIAAAGNSASDSWGYPAGYPTVMSVGSVMESGELSGFSTRNDQVEITGPGSAVLSTWKNNGYNTISGTSMACPHVAGVAALLWSHFPECTNNQIRNAMIRSAAEPPASDSRNTAGWDKYFGWGTVDAQAAYILLESGCEIAGGLKDPPSGKLPHDLAMGGKFQKDEGCTIDSHCDQFNPALGQSLCNTDTGSCERVVVPCTGVQKEVVVEILTDNYPGETTWTLIDLCGYGENISGGPYTRRSRTYSSSNDVCEGRYKFQINDSYGDGICCGYGSGSYSIKYDGVEAASGGSFQYNELKTFGTPCQSDPTPPPTTPPPTEPPTAQPTPVPTTAAPTAAPTTSPTAAPTTSPTPVPSAPPTASPTPVPTTAAPTPVPTTAAPTSAPTSSPTASPTTSPTPVPSAPPTSSPTPVPTTAAPTPVPTTAAPTVSPTSSPTASPSTPPTAAPTSATSSPTKNPTAAPTSSPTSSPVVPSKTLFCGRGDGYVPCAEGRTKTAPVNEEHEVRCCRDCTGINCSRPWKRKCSSLDPNLYARSKVGGVCKVGTFAEAQQICENASNDDSSRLCTPKEIENNCAKGTGCQFDKQLVWACGNDGYACATDAECCGSCVNGTCGSGSGSSLFS